MFRRRGSAFSFFGAEGLVEPRITGCASRRGVAGGRQVSNPDDRLEFESEGLSSFIERLTIIAIVISSPLKAVNWFFHEGNLRFHEETPSLSKANVGRG